MAALSAGVRLNREIGSKFLVEFLSFRVGIAGLYGSFDACDGSGIVAFP